MMKREEEIQKKLEVGRPKSEVGRQKAEANSEESSCWHWSLDIAGVQSSEFKVQSSGFKVQSLKKLNLSTVSFALEKSGQAVDFSQRIKEISPVMRLAVQNRLALSRTNKTNFNSFLYTPFSLPQLRQLAEGRGAEHFIRPTGN